MINWLRGTVRDIDPAGIVSLDVHGVGYEANVSMQTLCRLTLGEQVELHIHTHVREDQITLFGFASRREKEMFRKLTSVSGVGVRTGLSMLSGMPVDDILRAIDSADDTAIARVPGIGKKTAQRLILELRGKLVDAETESGPAGVLQDVRSALVNLGYKPAQVDASLKKIDVTDDFEACFKAALKAMA